MKKEMKVIKLEAVSRGRGMSLMKALEGRESVREFASQEVSSGDLSDLLWAANGINRPEFGYRTAPSAMNAQEIDLYVCRKEGAYLYEPAARQLVMVSEEDVRPWIIHQQSLLTAPLFLLLVADLSRLQGGDSQRKLLMSAMDAGCVSENISLFCTAAGLATVPRVTMNEPELRKALNLNSSQHLLMNHPIGYPCKGK